MFATSTTYIDIAMCLRVLLDALVVSRATASERAIVRANVHKPVGFLILHDTTFFIIHFFWAQLSVGRLSNKNETNDAASMFDLLRNII